MLHFPNGATGEVTIVGRVTLSSDIILEYVFFVPEFSYNLLSISKLLRDSKCQATFTYVCCSINAPGWSSPLKIGKKSNGLYLLSTDQICLHKIGSTSSVSAYVATVNPTLLWHFTLGHVPSPVFKMFSIDGLTQAITLCDCCMLAKKTRQSFSTSLSTATYIFDLVHIDLWGPYRNKTHQTCSMFLMIVDDKSRVTRVYLLFDKTQVVKMFVDFIQYVETQFDVKIKAVRSDNGSEFPNKAMISCFAAKGIVHETTCVYTPEQNGLVERKH